MDKNEIKKRVLNAVEILGLEEFLKRKPKELSGGQRQRVALGRAIVREPSVFLMDEPLSNLDAKLRVAMRSEIKKLHKKLRTTFIYVTHDQTEALTMGDNVVVLNEGNVVQQGTPKEIFNSPENTFVATFMGALPMNIIPKDGKLMGFRPDDMMAGDKGDIVFEVKPDFEEILGCDKILYFETEGTKCCAKISADDDTTGIVKLSVPSNKIIFFDKDTKKRLA
jgi:multiple sugar transport system ATP-binding protein